MRTYPHGTDAEAIAENLADESRTVAEDEPNVQDAQARGNAMFLWMHGESLQAVAAYRHALGESPSAWRGELERALRLRYRAIELGVLLDPFDFIGALALATTLRRSGETQALASLPQARYTHDDVIADPIVYGAAAILSAFILGNAAVIGPLTSELSAADVTNVHRYDRMLFHPLIVLLHAVHENDPAAVTRGFAHRDAELIRFFRRADDRNDPEALLDVPGLAVAALARERGIHAAEDSVYRPLALLDA